LEAIDNNTAIMFTVRVAMDTFPLAQRWQKGAIPGTTLERLARGDKSARFQTRGRHEGFGVMSPPNFSMVFGLNPSVKLHTLHKSVVPTGVTILLGLYNPPHRGHGKPPKPELLYPLVWIPCYDIVN
jgi:hypothetical protein